MKRYTLKEALDLIPHQTGLKAEEINAVQFEDGSGYKFNYQLKNYDAVKEDGWRFIALKDYEGYGIWPPNYGVFSYPI